MENEVRQLVAEALERFSSSEDKGAPFERVVLQALLNVRKNDPAEFQRMKAMIEESGVPKRDLSDALKLQMETAAKEALPSHFAGTSRTNQRIGTQGLCLRPHQGDNRHPSQPVCQVRA